MAGFDNDVMYAENVDFTGSFPVSGQINQDGELLIGAASAPYIRSGLLTGSGGITITNGPGTINIDATSAIGVTSVTGTANRITSSGGSTPVINIDPNYVGQTSITTLGTITTGVWTGTTIAVANGGTGATTLTNRGVLIGQGTSAVAATAAGTAGQVLQSGGAGANPSYSTPTYPSASGSTGKILRSDGTNNVYTTATFPDTAGSSGNVLTSDGTNWTSASSSGGVLVTTYNLADSPTTWNKNANTKVIEVYIWGGGGGGGSGRKGTSTSSSGGGGGGQGGFVYCKAPATAFNNSESIVVGRGGVGGLAQTTNATNGLPGDGVTAATNSSFGPLVAPAGTGGQGGSTAAVNSGTSGNTLRYNLVYDTTSGTAVSSGSTTTGSSPADVTGVQGPTPSRGGGGGGGDTGTGRAGGHGGDWVSLTSSIILAGGTAGTADGGSGGNGNPQATTADIYTGGTGGGGGGGARTQNGGRGGDGGLPGGAGGGGGGGISSSFNSGAGGDGAAGRIIVIEYR